MGTAVATTTSLPVGVNPSNTALSPSSYPVDSPDAVNATLGPVEHIACYSRGADGSIHYDLSSSKQFVEPTRFPADLLRNRDACAQSHRKNKYIGHPSPLDNIVGACLNSHAEDRIRQAHVVTWRGILKKFMRAETLDAYISYVDGVLYIEEFDPHPTKLRTRHIYDGYQGYAFEALCTGGGNVILDSWAAVVSRRLGDLNLVFAGEVDCTRGQYNATSDNFVELKTLQVNKRIKDPRSWFIQSHLLGVPEIVVGHRDENFQLQRIESIFTDKMPISAGGWTPEAGYMTAYTALKQLREFCSSAKRQDGTPDTAKMVWRVQMKAGKMKGVPGLLQKNETAKLNGFPNRQLAGRKRVGLLVAEHLSKLRELRYRCGGSANICSLQWPILPNCHWSLRCH